jgi:hypothetical protein
MIGTRNIPKKVEVFSQYDNSFKFNEIQISFKKFFEILDNLTLIQYFTQFGHMAKLGEFTF